MSPWSHAAARDRPDGRAGRRDRRSPPRPAARGALRGGAAGGGASSSCGRGNTSGPARAADALGPAQGAGAEPPARAAILAARAERALGLLAEARRRLERPASDAADDLRLRAELALLLDAVGDRGAVKDLVNRSYDDWEGGRVDRRDPLELLAMASLVAPGQQLGGRQLRPARGACARRARPGSASRRTWPGASCSWANTPPTTPIACFREVLALDPNHPDAQVGLARVLLEQGYDGEAALQADRRRPGGEPAPRPGAGPARGDRPRRRGLGRRWPRGVAALRRTNPHDPGAAWLAASLARAARRSGRRTRRSAIAGWRCARPTATSSPPTAEALVRHRRYEDAREVAADGVEREGTHARLLTSLGNTLLRLGEEDAGLAMLRRAWDRDPYDVRTYNLLNLFEKVIPDSLRHRSARAPALPGGAQPPPGDRDRGGAVPGADLRALRRPLRLPAHRRR